MPIKPFGELPTPIPAVDVESRVRAVRLHRERRVNSRMDNGEDKRLRTYEVRSCLLCYDFIIIWFSRIVRFN